MLKNRHIHILRWFMSSLMAVLFTAIASSCDDDAEPRKQTMLTVYVYSPERAATLSRAETGNVNAAVEEATIHSLQIWIYESESKAYVAYLSTEDVTTLNMGEGATYQLPVTDDFAERKPDVNVYVLANVKAANCGVTTLDDQTSHPDLLDGAKIAKSYFGLGVLLKPLVRTVPAEGLPMAGKLTVQPVVGDAPALRVGTMEQVATVQLTRAVSKLRFIFAKTTGQPAVSITSIKMKEGMIPDEEYLFKTPASMTYNSPAAELLGSTKGDIAATTNPTDFLYFDQEAQAYEDLISNAGLTVEGPIYLRESDRQLEGTIHYTIDGGDELTTDFQMHQAGDFLRNHTWIVYAYYAGSDRLQVQSLYVKEWGLEEKNHELYNW